MKKMLAILLVLTMVFAFAGCDINEKNASGTGNSGANASDEKDGTISSETGNDGKDNNTTDETSGESKSEWDHAIQSQKFDNVTFSYNATFESGYAEKGPHSGTYKLTKDGMLFDGEVITDEESITAARTVFLDTAVAIVKNSNHFIYNEANNNYTSKERITYNIAVLVYEATITVDDVLVIFDADNNIAKIACKMTQQFTENNKPMTYVLDVEFAFADYGTTTLD